MQNIHLKVRFGQSTDDTLLAVRELAHDRCVSRNGFEFWLESEATQAQIDQLCEDHFLIQILD